MPRLDNLSNTISTPYLRIHSAVRLEIVEQSSKPVVITDEGVEVMGSVGPYLLGQALILVTPAPSPSTSSVVARAAAGVHGRGRAAAARGLDQGRRALGRGDGPGRREQPEEEHAGNYNIYTHLHISKYLRRWCRPCSGSTPTTGGGVWPRRSTSCRWLDILK